MKVEHESQVSGVLKPRPKMHEVTDRNGDLLFLTNRPDIDHQWMLDMLKAGRVRVVPRVTSVVFRHEDWCASGRGQACDCDPCPTVLVNAVVMKDW